MRHCYIFDYNTGEIYHCEIPAIDCTNDILKLYIYNHYGYRVHNDTRIMITDSKQQIKEL